MISSLGRTWVFLFSSANKGTFSFGIFYLFRQYFYFDFFPSIGTINLHDIFIPHLQLRESSILIRTLAQMISLQIFISKWFLQIKFIPRARKTWTLDYLFLFCPLFTGVSGITGLGFTRTYSSPWSFKCWSDLLYT
jgi:hypothetical protein